MHQSIRAMPVSNRICMLCIRRNSHAQTLSFSSTRRNSLASDGGHHLARATRTKPISPAWFSPTGSVAGNAKLKAGKPEPEQQKHGEQQKMERNDHGKVEDRTLGIGSTIRVLQKHLPSLLQSPPPSAILSPSISLHLFPSTHPDLPTVRGRMAYMAALWTTPVAWGHIPGVNVKLEILSERMVGEEFVVRWQTENTPESAASSRLSKDDKASPADTVFNILKKDEKEGSGFAGMFIFGFDEMGRIAKHTVEHADTGMNDEGKIIGVAEWLMKKAKRGGGLDEGGGGLVLGCNSNNNRRK